MLSVSVYRGLRAAGLTAFARRLRSGGVVLCYHNVTPESRMRAGAAPGVHMPVDRFRRQIQWLVAHYDVRPLSTLLRLVASHEPLNRVACVTFDDAYAGVFEHAWPVLRDLNVTPTVFVIANAPDAPRPFWWDHPAVIGAEDAQHRMQWLTALHGDANAILDSLAAAPGSPILPPYMLPADWSTIRDAGRSGIEIGVHSASHRSLPTLEDAELGQEIETSRAMIARETGTTPTCFAFPYGRWDERVRNCVQRAGYEAAFTLDYNLVGGDADPWALPRVNLPAGIDDAAFEAWLAGLALHSIA